MARLSDLMLQRDDQSILSGQLEALLATHALAPANQRVGMHLLGRLNSDIQVILSGPQEAAKAVVLERLNTQALPQTQVKLIPWGAQVTPQGVDVCIWFTTGFAADEYQLWESMPNRLKDHSFLVPVLDASDACSAVDPAFLEAMDAIAAEEFYDLCPMSLPASNGVPPTDGVENLLGQVASIIKNGIAADADNAQMFLAQHADIVPDLPPNARQMSKPDPQDQPGQGAMLKEMAHSAAPPSAPLPERLEPPAPQDGGADMALFRAAHDDLCAHISALEPLTEASTEAEFAQVLATCQETLEAAASILADCQEPGWDDVQSAADEVLLMGMEGGVGPAITAVTTLLQIKRQLSVELCANSPVFT